MNYLNQSDQKDWYWRGSDRKGTAKGFQQISAIWEATARTVQNKKLNSMKTSSADCLSQSSTVSKVGKAKSEQD